MASVMVTGGTPPYQYLWNNGKTDQSIMGLVAGNYKVTVVDANGCMAISNTIEITEPVDAVQVSITIDNQPDCEGGLEGAVEPTLSNPVRTPLSGIFQDIFTDQSGKDTRCDH